MRELKIGTSWVRGVVGDAFTPELIVNFACAFGTWVDGGPVVIGRDTRRSSTMVRSAVLAGLLSPGCDIIDMGLCPTPLVSFAVRELGATGGISITGSHNDAEWNALKFIGPDGMLLNGVKGEELLDLYHAQSFRTAPRDRLKPLAEAPDVLDRYMEHLLAALDVKAIQSRKFKMAVDFCNGACAPITTRFLRKLDCTVLPLHEEALGVFAHPPAPTPANMSDLAAMVRRSNVDRGAALNVDGDRIAFVTAGGLPLSEEYTLPLAAKGRLARRPGPIVTNLSTSRMIDEVAEARGQRVIRTSVGESPVMDRGIEEGAVLAGEGSGGIGSLPAAMTFDALLTLSMILEAMAATDRNLAGLVKRLPGYVMRKGTIPCMPIQAYRVIDDFRSAYTSRDADRFDGVRVEWDDAWLHVRASNTEPLVRVIVEAEPEQRAAALYEEAMARAERAAGKAKGA